MTTPHISCEDASQNLNHLRRGMTYRASTRDGISIGEYLGMETSYGDRAILLRHPAGTESISLCDVTGIHVAAA